jgi:hypothetical protein
MRRILVVLLILLAPGADASAESDSVADLRRRLDGLARGAYHLERTGQPPASAADLSRCLRGLASRDDTLRGPASLAVESLAGGPIVAKAPEALLRELAHAALAAMDAKDPDVREWAGRAIGALASESGRWSPADTAPVVKRVLRGLASAADEAGWEERRRAANLAVRMAKHLDGASRRSVAEALFRIVSGLALEDAGRSDAALRAALEKHTPAGDRALACHEMCWAALCRLPTGGERDRVVEARLVLAEFERERPRVDTVHHGRAVRLHGLARRAAGLERGPLRSRCVDLLIGSLDDRDLVYAVTSGVRTPLRHAGADALAVVAPSFDARELARAEKAVAAAATPGLGEPDDLESMFREVRGALAARKEALSPEGD